MIQGVWWSEEAYDKNTVRLLGQYDRPFQNPGKIKDSQDMAAILYRDYTAHSEAAFRKKMKEGVMGWKMLVC